ncbi:unnamed protein product, partial [marine sediment metagenome]
MNISSPCEKTPIQTDNSVAEKIQPLVSIQIVTWNRKKELVRAIESTLNQTYPNVEIVVVDNASTDGTAQAIAQQFPQVRLGQLHK